MTLLEIETAASALAPDEKRQLVQFLLTHLREESQSQLPPKGPHRVIDIPPVSVGKILVPFTPDDDILGEMLEGRK